MPKIVNKEEKRNQIIGAAFKIFSKLGVPNTKMIQIAEAAGIGKGTIYEYFKSKEDLFYAVIQAFMHSMDSDIARKLKKHQDPGEKMQAYFDEWANVFDSEFMNFAEIMLDIWAQGIRQDNPKIHFDLNQLYDTYRGQLVDIINEGIAKDVFRADVNSVALASVIIGALDGIMLQWIVNKNLFSPKEAVEQFAEMTIQGISVKS